MSHEHEQWEPHTGGSLAIGPGWLQLSLRVSKLGGRHHLHGLGDLLHVLDRLQTNLY